MRAVVLCAVLGAATVAVEAQTPADTYFTASDGVRIHYVTTGYGSPVVLIHGLGADVQSAWFATGVAQALSARHRVVALDLRGHGKSDKPHDVAKYGMRLWQDVIELMDHLAVRRAHIHGYALGAGVVDRLLANVPLRFITAIFGGAGPLEIEPWRSQMPPDVEGTDPQDADARQRFRLLPDRDEVALKAVLDSMSRFIGAKRLDLSTVNIPVLAINAEFDQPIAKTHRFQRELKQFKSVVLPGKSHVTALFPSYMPKLYVMSLVEFIDANDPKK